MNGIFHNSIPLPPRCVQLLLASVFLAISSTGSTGSEYSDEDFEPNILDVEFTKEFVGFFGEQGSATGTIYGEAGLYFVFDRSQGLGREISPVEFRRIFVEPRVLKAANTSAKHTLSTSDGTTYSVPASGACDWDSSSTNPRLIRPPGPSDHSLMLPEKVIPIGVDVCNGITALEHVGDHLWIGTDYIGDQAVGPGQGLIIQDRATGKVVKSLRDVDAPTSSIRLDPYTGEVWVAYTYLIDRMRPDGTRISRYRFLQQFDSVTRLPVMRLTSEPGDNNRIAVLARYMSKSNAIALYEATTALSKEDIQRFNLYDFFMCCNISPSYYPVSMNVMVPPLLRQLDEAEAGDNNYDKERWIQTVCAFKDPRVLTYFDSRSVDDNDTQSTLMQACIRKLEAGGVGQKDPIGASPADQGGRPLDLPLRASAFADQVF